MLKFKLIAFFSVFSLCLSAQSDLQPILQKMNTLLKTSVEVDKEQVSQELTWQDESPWKVTLTKKFSGKKEQLTERYEFNLADFNTYLVSRQSKEKYQGVECRTDRDRKYIGYWENNEKENYTNKFLLYLPDANAADEFVSQFKAAIPLAQKAWEATVQIPGSMEEIQTYLASKITTVTEKDKKLVQTLKADPKVADRAILTTDQSGTGEPVTEVQEWSWGDLSTSAIELKPKGDQVTVEAQTRRKLRYIKVAQNGNFKQYRNELVFVLSTPDEAKLVIKALEKIIPMGEKALEARLPKVNSVEEGLQLLQSQLTPITSKGKRLEQSLKGQTDLTLLRKEINEEDKGKNKEIEYQWFLGDLNGSAVDLDISSSKIMIQVPILKKDKLVAVRTNGEQSNYENNIELELPDVEAARLANAVLPQIINLVPKTDIQPESEAWLIEALTNQPAFKGKKTITLKKRDNDCTWTLNIVTTEEKKSVEETWEFELNRIDPAAVEFKVSGKNIEVVLPARYKEKVVKYYKDGKQSFTNSIEFPVESIDKAKKVVKTWEKMAEKCK